MEVMWTLWVASHTVSPFPLSYAVSRVSHPGWADAFMGSGASFRFIKVIGFLFSFLLILCLVLFGRLG